nr:basic proline-rich protein-like [Equus caballus]
MVGAETRPGSGGAARRRKAARPRTPPRCPARWSRLRRAAPGDRSGRGSLTSPPTAANPRAARPAPPPPPPPPPRPPPPRGPAQPGQRGRPAPGPAPPRSALPGPRPREAKATPSSLKILEGSRRSTFMIRSESGCCP